GEAAAAPVTSIDFQLANSSRNSWSPETLLALDASIAPVICVAVAVSLARAGEVMAATAAKAPRTCLRNIATCFPVLLTAARNTPAVAKRTNPRSAAVFCEMVGTPRRLSELGGIGQKVNQATPA